MNRIRRLAKPVLGHRRWPLLLLLLAAAIYTPTLDDGFRLDDHFHHARLLDVLPGERAPAWSLFDFVRLEEAGERRVYELSMMPWWSQPGLRLSFLRPVSGLSHGLDHRLWPRSPVAMHAHSVLWFLAAVLMAWALFRRLLEPWAAGLASLILALDDTFAVPVGWLANRNAVLALAFGLGALLAHDAWRRGGWRAGTALAPALLLAAVLSNEGAVAVGGYLLAYAAFLDPSRGRWWALLPCTLVGLLWAATYVFFDYGIHGSGVYVHPLADFGRFLAVAGERLPLLVWGQWAFPSPEIYLLVSPAWRPWVVVLGGLLAAALVALLWPLRRDPVSRFFAAGMVLSFLPACTTFPANRLLVFASLGGAGLLAQLLTRAPEKTSGRCRRLALSALVAVHLVLAPLSLRVSLEGLGRLEALVQVAASSLSAAPMDAEDTLVLVDAPTSFVVAFVPVLRALGGESLPRSVVLLSSGLHGAALERRGERSVAVRPVGGYLVGRGSEPAELGLGPVDLHRGLHLLDHLYRADPFTEGERIELPAAAVEITQAEQGRALEATFHFREPLEHRRHLWFCWKWRGFEACEPPTVGESMMRPPMTGGP